MLVYAGIMGVAALLFFGVGMLIYKGKPHLLFNVKGVKDRAAFGEAVGLPVFLVAAVCLLSGIAALIGGENSATIYTAVGLFVAGFVGAFVWIEVIKHKFGVAK